MPSISTASFFSATSFSLGLNLSAVISVVMLRRSQSLHLRIMAQDRFVDSIEEKFCKETADM
ncbi:hypothetical protein HN51_044203, partial [Arachis hypogaea]